MSKRKKFGISESLSQGFSDTIAMVENDEGIYRNVRMPMSKLERDPENPRNILLSFDEVLNKAVTTDSKIKEKQKQLDELEQLAFSIETSGLINPVSVYKHLDTYRIIAGERRFLATLMLGKTEIDARVFKKKPSNFELKLIQWFENTNREDLSLFEKLENVKNILASKEDIHFPKDITGVLIEKLIGMSKTQSALYATVLKGPEDVYEAIEGRRVTNLKVAEIVAKCKTAKSRAKAIELFQDGVTPSKAKEIIANLEKLKQPESSLKQPAKKGKKKTRVKLGETKKPHVVQTLVGAVIALPQFDHYKRDFSKVNWDSYDSATEAFSKLLTLLEAEA